MPDHEITFADLRSLLSGEVLAMSATCSCGEWGLTHLVDGRPAEPGLVAGEDELVYNARLHQEMVLAAAGY